VRLLSRRARCRDEYNYHRRKRERCLLDGDAQYVREYHAFVTFVTVVAATNVHFRGADRIRAALGRFHSRARAAIAEPAALTRRPVVATGLGCVRTPGRPVRRL
jgi:hypothetical protein